MFFSKYYLFLIGETLFHKAVRLNDFSAIQFLIKHGADVNKPNANVKNKIFFFLLKTILSRDQQFYIFFLPVFHRMVILLLLNLIL